MRGSPGVVEVCEVRRAGELGQPSRGKKKAVCQQAPGGGGAGWRLQVWRKWYIYWTTIISVWRRRGGRSTLQGTDGIGICCGFLLVWIARSRTAVTVFQV